MRRKWRQIAGAALAGLLLITTPAAAVSRPTGPVTIRVGLFYGNNALPGANLDNNVGSGYRFGYFDSNLQFTQLGYTGVGQISMVKTQNVYYSGGNYTDTVTSGVVVGCYHLQLPNSYSDFESAKAAAAQVQGGFPAWINGTYYVRTGAYTSMDAAAAAQGGISGSTVVGSSSYGISVVKTETSTILFQFDGGADLTFGVKPGTDDSVKTATWFKGYRYYGSFRYQRVGGGNLTVVNILPIDDYLKGVISVEMSDNWPIEALKAQAVASRCYALTVSKHRSSGFDVCATTDCQAYQGLNRAGANTDQAVDDTSGIYATYNGEIAQTLYFSHDGGATEDVKNVWGSSIPYLSGVTDPYEASVAATIPNYRWTVTLTKEAIAEKVRGKGYTGCTDVVDFYVSERSETGNVIAFTVVDSQGKKYTFSNKVGEQCRLMFGFRSINYTISGGSGDSAGGGSYFVNDSSNTLPSVSGAYAVDGNGNVSQVAGTPFVITDAGTSQLNAAPVGTTTGSSGTGSATYTVSGSGWGHLVGMSQWGANAMAKQGMTYDQILKFYYTGVNVG